MIKRSGPDSASGTGLLFSMLCALRQTFRGPGTIPPGPITETGPVAAAEILPPQLPSLETTITGNIYAALLFTGTSSENS